MGDAGFVGSVIALEGKWDGMDKDKNNPNSNCFRVGVVLYGISYFFLNGQTIGSPLQVRFLMK